MAKTKFTQELFDDICQAIATSENGIAKICKIAGLALQTFYNWLGDDKDLLERYARAKDAQLQLMVEQILTISDDGLNDVMEDAEGNIRVNYDHIQRSKLRVDTRKWLLSKL
jgi:AcrR family transcriptional regulator